MNYKIKWTFFLLLTSSIFTLMLTSCEKEMKVNNELTEVIEPPLSLEELDDLFSKLDAEENTNIELRANCKCKRVYASRRSSTSSYVYCQRWQNNSPGPVTYALTGNPAAGNPYSDWNEVNRYYSTFHNLINNKPYILEIYLPCNTGGPFTSNAYTFYQNTNYPSPHNY